MIIRQPDDMDGTDRDVDAPTFRSRRMVLAGDEVGFSFHDTLLHEGTVTDMWYKHHVEAVYCIEGSGELLDKETDTVHPVGPGTLYLLDRHDRHRLTAHTDLRMICVFNPPVTGQETHDSDGAYPLLEPDAGASA